MTNSRLILTFIICITSSIFPKCRDDIFLDNTDSNVISMLNKLPSQYERGNISPKDGRLLYDLILQRGYKNGLEIGTSNGYSALWQGLALKQTNGKLLTIEIDSIAGREAQDNFNKAGLQYLINLKIDDAKNVLKNSNDSFDFVFVDTGDNSLDFFELAIPFVSKGGTLVIHNVKKSDSRLNTILNNPDFETKFKSRFFYKILICTKK